MSAYKLEVYKIRIQIKYMYGISKKRKLNYLYLQKNQEKNNNL